jgi:hypothetical protein
MDTIWGYNWLISHNGRHYAGNNTLLLGPASMTIEYNPDSSQKKMFFEM